MTDLMYRRMGRVMGVVLLSTLLNSCIGGESTPQTSGEEGEIVEAIAVPSPNVGSAAPSPSPSPTNALPKDWHRYQSPRGNASILFPKEPKADVNQIETPNGKTEIFLARYTNNGDRRAYLFSHNAIPVPKDSYVDIETALDSSRGSLATGISATVTSEIKLKLNGFPGREIRLTRPGKFAAKARIFYADGVLYQAVVVAEDAQLDQGAVMNFLRSLQIQKKPKTKSSS